MTINNPEAYVNSLWDWAILEGCFGDTNIRPTDIDGFVERRGHFLVIETKGPGVLVGTGQRRTFESLRETGVFTVIVLWGEPGQPEAMEVLYEKPFEQDSRKPAVLDDLLRVVSWWFEYASSTPVVMA